MERQKMKKSISMFVSFIIVLLMTSGVAAEAAEPLCKASMQSYAAVSQNNSFNGIQPSVASGPNYYMLAQSEIEFSMKYKTDTKVVLQWNSPTEIMDSISYYEITSENDVIITDISKDVTSIELTDLAQNTSYNLKISAKNESNEIISESEPINIVTNMVIDSNTVLFENIDVIGDLYIKSDLNLNGNTINVAGNVIISSYTLTMNTGKMYVKGDFRMQNYIVDSNGEYTYTGGSGILKMQNPEDYLNVDGDFVVQSNNNKYITDGVIEVKRNFYEYYCYFYCAGRNKVVLSGIGLQEVYFEQSDSTFNILELKNPSEEGILFKSAVNYNQFITNNCKYAFSNCDSWGWTLEEDEVYEGDLILGGKELNLNGHNLTVKGDLIQTTGMVNINGGSLAVEGDYRIQAIDEAGYKLNNACLNMTKDTDKVSVDGNFVMQTKYDHTGHLTDGTLEVKGDFTIVSCFDKFVSNENFTLILSGNQKQTVSWGGGLGMLVNSSVGNLILQNTSEEGIAIDGMIDICGELDNRGSKLTDGVCFCLSDNGSFVGEEWNGNLAIKNKVLTENLKINGSLFVIDNCDLNGKILTVTQDVGVTNGNININKGKLIVGDDLNICYFEYNQDGMLEKSDYGHGSITMRNPEDYVYVKNDFYVSNSSETNSVLSDGVMEVQGDFTVCLPAQSGYIEFAATGNHKVILSGEDVQNVYFAGAYFDKNVSVGNFNILEITKPLDTGYKFNRSPVWNVLIERSDDNEIPTTPTELHCTDKTASTISLEWNESTDNQSVNRYDIYRNDRLVGSSLTASFTDRNLFSNMAYTYYVIAYDAAGNGSEISNKITEITNTDNDAPTAPTGLRITSKTDNSVTLTWNASTDNVHVDSYAVYRDGILIKNVVGRLFTDSNLVSGSYTYTVKAIDNVGNYSLDSNSVVYNNMTPYVPVLSVESVTDTSITLSWTADDNPGFRGYYIYRNGVHFVTVTYQMQYTDISISPNMKYIYSIESYDEFGNVSRRSAAVEVYTGVDETSPVIDNISLNKNVISSELGITVTAHDNMSVDSVMLQYSYDGSSWIDIEKLSTIRGAVRETISYTLNCADFDEGTVSIRAIAFDKSGNISIPSTVKQALIDHTAPAKPSNIRINGDVGCLEIIWDAAEESDWSHYTVYRRVKGTTDFTVVQDYHKYLNYFDRNIELGTTYEYRVVSVDLAGNCSEPSDIVEGSFSEDSVEPEILSIYPKNGETLYANQKMSVSCRDNYCLAQIVIEYKHENDEEWTTLVTKDMSEASKIVSADFDTSDFVSGIYTVKITLTDYAGNTSEAEMQYHYVECALSTPSLTVTPSGWSAELNWTMDNVTNLAGYNIYRKNSGYETLIRRTVDTSYCDETVTAGQTYEYLIEAVDIYGHTVRGQYVSVVPTNDDSVFPVANAGFDKETIVGKVLQFDGSKSTDNRGVTSYQWNFGDGYTSKSVRPSHTYNEAGTYTVTLTVSDSAGNSDTAETKVIVRGSEYEALTIKVVNKANNVPLSDTMIYCELQGSDVTAYTTDNSGLVSIIAKKGEYDFYFYHEGYLPVCQKIKIPATEFPVPVKLEQKEIVTGELNVRRLELNEIEAQGIDVTAPENQFVYEYEAQIIIDPTKGSEKITIISNGKGELINTEEKIVWKPDPPQGGTGSSDECINQVIYTQVIPNEEHPEIPPTVVILNVKMDISWLKEFFEVEMTVMNNADTMFPIENAAAVLNLPDGLSLAPTAAYQSLLKEIGTIEGNSSVTRSWFIRGDKAGEYNVEADFSGTLMPFGEPVKAKFVTSEPLTVHGGNALNFEITYRVKDDLTGIEYAEFELTNVSDINIYNVSVSLAGLFTENDVEEIHLEYPSGLLEVVKWGEDGPYGEIAVFLPALIEDEINDERMLKPGEKLRGILIIRKH